MFRILPETYTLRAVPYKRLWHLSWFQTPQRERAPCLRIGSRPSCSEVSEILLMKPFEVGVDYCCLLTNSHLFEPLHSTARHWEAVYQQRLEDWTLRSLQLSGNYCSLRETRPLGEDLRQRSHYITFTPPGTREGGRVGDDIVQSVLVAKHIPTMPSLIFFPNLKCQVDF